MPVILAMGGRGRTVRKNQSGLEGDPASKTTSNTKAKAKAKLYNLSNGKFS